MVVEELLVVLRLSVLSGGGGVEDGGGDVSGNGMMRSRGAFGGVFGRESMPAGL